MRIIKEKANGGRLLSSSPVELDIARVGSPLAGPESAKFRPEGGVRQSVEQWIHHARRFREDGGEDVPNKQDWSCYTHCPTSRFSGQSSTASLYGPAPQQGGRNESESEELREKGRLVMRQGRKTCSQ